MSCQVAMREEEQNLRLQHQSHLQREKDKSRGRHAAPAHSTKRNGGDSSDEDHYDHSDKLLAGAAIFGDSESGVNKLESQGWESDHDGSVNCDGHGLDSVSGSSTDSDDDDSMVRGWLSSCFIFVVTVCLLVMTIVIIAVEIVKVHCRYQVQPIASISGETETLSFYMPCVALPCLALPRLATFCQALPCLVMPCHALRGCGCWYGCVVMWVWVWVGVWM
jgi:hypothetical protein